MFDSIFGNNNPVGSDTPNSQWVTCQTNDKWQYDLNSVEIHAEEKYLTVKFRTSDGQGWKLEYDKIYYEQKNEDLQYETFCAKKLDGNSNIVNVDRTVKKGTFSQNCPLGEVYNRYMSQMGSNVVADRSKISQAMACEDDDARNNVLYHDIDNAIINRVQGTVALHWRYQNTDDSIETERFRYIVFKPKANRLLAEEDSVFTNGRRTRTYFYEPSTTDNNSWDRYKKLLMLAKHKYNNDYPQFKMPTALEKISVRVAQHFQLATDSIRVVNGNLEFDVLGTEGSVMRIFHCCFEYLIDTPTMSVLSFAEFTNGVCSYYAMAEDMIDLHFDLPGKKTDKATEIFTAVNNYMKEHYVKNNSDIRMPKWVECRNKGGNDSVWEYDENSVICYKDRFTLYVKFRTKQESGWKVEYDKIFYEQKNDEQRCADYCVKCVDDKGNVLSSSYAYNSTTFVQHSPVGEVYNRYMPEFGSQIITNPSLYTTMVYTINNETIDNKICCDVENAVVDREAGTISLHWVYGLSKDAEDRIRFTYTTFRPSNDTMVSEERVCCQITENGICREDTWFSGESKITETWNDMWLRIYALAKHKFFNDYPAMPPIENKGKIEVDTGDNREWYVALDSIKKFSDDDFECDIFYQKDAVVRVVHCRFEYFDELTMTIKSVAEYKNGVCTYYATDSDMFELHLDLPFNKTNNNTAEAIRKCIERGYMKKNNISNANVQDNGVFANVPDDNLIKQKFANVIGLDSVKEMLLEQYKQLLIDKERKNLGLATFGAGCRNMIFTGNPGTGKTTVARKVAEVYKELGLLKTGQLIETDRSKLVASFIGQTAPKTEAVFNSAIGGVLFIDEAYSLARGGDNDFGKEAIDTLVKLMEDHREDTIVILAGYTKEMAQFMDMNSGLKSRFPVNIEFPDYTTDELTQIAISMLKEKKFKFKGVKFAEKLKEGVSQRKLASGMDAGNGRLVRNICDEIVKKQSNRLFGKNNSKEEYETLLIEDIPESFANAKEYDLEADLAKVVGLESVKNYIRQLQANVKMNQVRKQMGMQAADGQTHHMIFAGNPGTGKTTMARIVADVLSNLGVIPGNKLNEVSRADLVAGYIGQTALKTEAAFKRAIGGIFFVDEAYSLAGTGNDFGKEAIDMLVKLMEDNRDNTVVILAGYTQNMKEFLNMNPGLQSRFPNWIEFPDYSVEELVKITSDMFAQKQFTMTNEAKEKLSLWFAKKILQPNFGNARDARNVFDKAILHLNMRVSERYSDMSQITPEIMSTIEAEDLELEDIGETTNPPKKIGF